MDTNPGTRPTDWWREAHWLLCEFRRYAQQRGLPELIGMLEPLKDRAATQILQVKLIVGTDGRDRRGRLGKRLASMPNPATGARLQSRAVILRGSDPDCGILITQSKMWVLW
ncbi:MAG TPA: hypothetical protein VNA27_16875 [Rubrobacteraceae bacterium]|nr:hypothetical protein [Rubrobacteraceae bacterium]